jgi:eukaryotic-like serine/threonine-protein kinase
VSSRAVDQEVRRLRRSYLLHKAFEWPAAVRSKRLRDACAGDDLMHEELCRLLAADACSQGLLDQSITHVAGRVFDQISSDEGRFKAGDRVGPYRLVRTIGEGGMGSVWQAERADGEFAQTVALKLIKSGMGGDAVKARFQRERELLARLAHPNIARLFDGGTSTGGHCYFAMEEIDGEPLMQHVARCRLNVTQRLRLFVPLCEAVAYAHRQLVVHRDLKPSNILVREDGSPVLLDFGIAKALDGNSDDITATQQRFLTRNYASPEQLRGDPVSTATDIYSLGAVLFELLTGRTYASVRVSDGMVRPSQTTPALSVARQLRGDCDTIVMKALAAAPALRYSTVQALLEDVQRTLDGRPILARPESARYRLRKFASRHRHAVAMGIIISIALATGFCLTLRARIETHRQTDRVAVMKNMVSGAMQNADSSPADYLEADSILQMLSDDGAISRRRVARQRAEAFAALAEGFQQLGQFSEAYRNYALALESLQIAVPVGAKSSDPVEIELAALNVTANDVPLSPTFDLSSTQWLARRALNSQCSLR